MVIKRLFLFFFLSICCLDVNSQNLRTYTPSTNIGDIAHNDVDYEVKVIGDWMDPSISNNWQDLFEYKAKLRRGVGDNKEEEVELVHGSFVSFDFETRQQDKIIIEIKVKWSDIDYEENKDEKGVIIRPISKEIKYKVLDNKTIRVELTKPQNFTVELDKGLFYRYKCLHVFANEMVPPVPTNDIHFKEGHFYDFINKTDDDVNFDFNSWTFIKDNLIPNAGQTIYIEGGAVINGGIKVRGSSVTNTKDNVRIFGRGIIDISSRPKYYNQDDADGQKIYGGVIIKNAKNINVDGIIVNDASSHSIELVDVDGVSIKNTKVFSRGVWGDGVNMASSKNVTVDGCFLRTSDDCIAVYATHVRDWDYNVDNTKNITVKNSSLLADRARPINIGTHGNRYTVSEIENNVSRLDDNGNKDKAIGDEISNLTFENIDVLDHNMPYNIGSGRYQGVMSIIAGDENWCHDFLFKDIRVESITRGRLFSIRVLPYVENSKGEVSTTEGQYISNIRFENIAYNTQGNGIEETKSVFEGLNSDRLVEGIYFNNLEINNEVISEWPDVYFEKNDYARNIVFNESENQCISSMHNDISFVSDIDGDQKQELVLINRDQCNSASVVKTVKINTSGGSISSSFIADKARGYLDEGDLTILADVNGNGIKDLVLINLKNGDGTAVTYPDLLAIEISTGNKLVYLSPTKFGSTLTGWVDNNDRMLIADADGDNDDDLIIMNTSGYSGGAIRAMDIRTGHSFFNSEHDGTYNGWLDNTDKQFVGNFDDDPAQELLLVNYSNYQGYALRIIDLVDNGETVFCAAYDNNLLYCQDNPATGTFSGWMDSDDMLFVSDVDGNDRDDLVFINSSSYAGGAVRVMSTKTGSTITSVSHGIFDNLFDDCDEIRFGDINSNGKKEMIMINSSSASGDAIKVLDLFSKQVVFCSSYASTSADCSRASGSYSGWLDSNDRLLFGGFLAQDNTDLLFLNSSINSGGAIRSMDLRTGHSYFNTTHDGSFNDWFNGIDNNSICAQTANKTNGNTESLNTDIVFVYPNPVNERLNIILPKNSEEFRIKILNILGVEIYSDSFQNKKEISVNTDTYTSGAYFLEIYLTGKIIKRTVIKN